VKLGSRALALGASVGSSMAAMDPQQLVEAMKALEDSLAVMVITQVLQDRPELAPPVVNFSVPNLTYAPATILTERRCRGTIKNFNAEMGYAYVDCKELSQIFGDDVLLHAKQIPADCAPQSKVTFACVLTKDNKPQAFDLRKDDSMPTMPGMGMGAQPGMMGCGGMMMGGCGGCPGMPGMGAMPGMGGCGGCPGMPMGGCGPMTGMPGCGGMPGMPTGMPGIPGMPNSMPNTMPNMAGVSPMMQQMMGKMPGGKGGCGGPVLGQFTGSIQSFNPKLGYGFIHCPDLAAQGQSSEVKIGQEELGEYEVGAQVSFTAFLNSAGQPEGKDLEAPNKVPRLMA